MQRRIGRRAAGRVAVAAVIALAVTALAWVGLAAGTFDGLQRQANDHLFPTGAADGRIVVVGIDARSISDAGATWPWDRTMQAALVERIHAAGARLIVYDLLLGQDRQGDDRLAGALEAASPVVLAATATVAAHRTGSLVEASDVTLPASSLLRPGVRVGTSNVTPDPADGIIRSMPMAIEARGHGVLPSLPLAAVAALDGAPPVPEIRPGGVQMAGRFVPTSDHAGMVVSWAPSLVPGVADGAYVSAGDVLRGRPSVRRLRGAIVLVGVADPSLGNSLSTPVDRATPGVFVVANALNTILTRDHVHWAGHASTLLWVAVLSFAAALLAQMASAWVATLATIGLAATYLTFAFWAFDAGRSLDLVYTEIALAVAFAASIGARSVVGAPRRRGSMGEDAGADRRSAGLGESHGDGRGDGSVVIPEITTVDSLQ
jgi:adenylate cyclase